MNPHPDLTVPVIQGLGWLYLLLFFLNLAWAIRSFRHDGHYDRFLGISHTPKAAVWFIYCGILLIVAATHLMKASGPDTFLLKLPEWFKNTVDQVIANPISFFAISIVGFVAMILLRAWWTRPTVAWVLFNLSVLFLGASMTDFDFRQIVGKPDNVPIVGMLYLVGFFTWLYFYKSVENDQRIAEGRPVAERELSDRVLVWPDLHALHATGCRPLSYSSSGQVVHRVAPRLRLTQLGRAPA